MRPLRGLTPAFALRATAGRQDKLLVSPHQNPPTPLCGDCRILVPRERLELSHPCGYQLLRLARLPIPPPRLDDFRKDQVPYDIVTVLSLSKGRHLGSRRSLHPASLPKDSAKNP